jgi:hypothetical protein
MTRTHKDLAHSLRELVSDLGDTTAPVGLCALGWQLGYLAI